MRLLYKNPSGLTLPRLNPGSPLVTSFVVVNKALGWVHTNSEKRSEQ